MFSGEAETSRAGLSDILITLAGILRHCLPQRAAAAAGGSASEADSQLPRVVIVYNDAAAMVAHLRDPATAAAVREDFQRVE
jgi:hypothetical protein